MTEVTISGEVYRTGKLTAMEQFYVVRRLLPVVSALGSIQDSSSFLQGMATALSKIPDDDCLFVISTCMRVCQRQQGQAWANVWVGSATKPQFDDIDLGTMINLVMTTLQENLAGFFGALPSVSTPGASPPNVQ